MKERPILMSAPMVRARLAGRKNQTRRECTHPLLKDLSYIVDCGDGWWGDEEGDVQVRCPYGEIGDRLWVRETWRVGAWRGPAHNRSSEHWVAVDYKADGYARREWLGCGDDRLERQSIQDAIRAGYTEVEGYFAWKPGESPCRWRPSIHMPRWASRTTLDVTRVRVERLQDISEADAKDEGLIRCGEGWRGAEHLPWFASPVGAYRSLWEEINGPESWAANPWVWVVEFK